jgi:2-keto-4-pentenoate hydratase/2-oxohepta-3-ene-1,7-dioic acid hydratase in catechol pathway
MKLLTFRTSEGLKLGVKTEKGILDVAKALKIVPSETKVPYTMDELLQVGEVGVSALNAYVAKIEAGQHHDLFLEEGSLVLGPCVPHPGKVIGIGLNYQGYLKRSNTPQPTFPYIFTKFPSAVRATDDPILIPSNSTQVDYEAELAIVIGKKARRVSPEEAPDYIVGYCNTNDFSARDLQYSTPSWLPGKCCDSFCPIGPYLVTSDEVGDPNNLNLRAYLNGKLYQESNTSDMILNCKEIVSGVSQFFTLEPGDIILTGTPEGIIMTWPEEERVWLQDDDEIIVEIEKLGRLTNRMKQEV